VKKKKSFTQKQLPLQKRTPDKLWRQRQNPQTLTRRSSPCHYTKNGWLLSKGYGGTTYEGFHQWVSPHPCNEQHQHIKWRIKWGLGMNGDKRKNKGSTRFITFSIVYLSRLRMMRMCSPVQQRHSQVSPFVPLALPFKQKIESEKPFSFHTEPMCILKLKKNRKWRWHVRL